MHGGYRRVEQRRTSKSIDDNIHCISSILPVEESFDIIRRDMVVGERNCTFYYLNGFIKDDVMRDIMANMFFIRAEQMPGEATEFSRRCIPYVDVKIAKEFDSIVTDVLSGLLCLFVDGYECAFMLDLRTYPARTVEEPQQDKSLRGPRDGFVETLVSNTSLIRRRIRDPRLIMKSEKVGKSSKMDVAICYMEGRVNPKVLDLIVTKIENLDMNELKMCQQTLAEALFPRKGLNPFPKYKFTERPDTAVACLYEGKVVMLVDNSPSALILPTSIFDMIEEPNDYYFPKSTALYLKFTRILITLITVFMIPLFMLIMQNPEFLPKQFDFIMIKDTMNLPLVWQFLIWELAIDGLRLASLTTPSMLTTPLSVLAGIVMGEYSVKSGWFNSEVMLYMAFVAVANYTQPNFELGYALKFMRLLLMILTGIFNLAGFIIGSIFVVVLICMNRTLIPRSFLDVRRN
ncbi:MAG: spore germination protein [Lachnospiraceae bacterium]